MLSPPQDKVRELQRTLYRTAKADPARRFHALYDKVYRSDVIERAWQQVRANRGAAGIDQVTLAEVEQYGIARLLDELAISLRQGSWRPQAARRVWIPKPGSDEKRPLSIPTVADRIVQTAVKIVIEPIFEADFTPASFGFRPKRSAHDALQVLLDEAWDGRRWVVETDIASCFEAIPHEGLMEAIEERICDQPLLKLLRAMLRAGGMEHGTVHHPVTGTPQGGVISPLLANVYLHRLDRRWQAEGRGRLVRYADDLVVMCATEQNANQALELLTALLGDLGLAPKTAKTRIVHLREGGEGLDFLGFHHRTVRGNTPRSRHLVFLARWPSRKAMQHARDRIRAITARSRLRVDPEELVGDLNAFLRGWTGYFRYGNSAHAFLHIHDYAVQRLALWVAKRHKRPRAYGWARVVHLSPNHMGLLTLDGHVVAPRPHRDWRETPKAAGERRR